MADKYEQVNILWDELISNIREKDYLGISKTRDIVIFGAGEKGINFHQFLTDMGQNVVCFCDNNPVKHNTVLHGLKVISPEELSTNDNVFVLIAIDNKKICEQIFKQLDSLNTDCVEIDKYYYNLVLNDFEDIYNNYLCDDKSKYTLYTILKARYYNDSKYYSDIYEDNQYFCLPSFQPDEYGQDVFVDAGAYVGDTLEVFLNWCGAKFKQAICFEPTNSTFKELQENARTLSQKFNLNESSIMLKRAGLGCNSKALPLYNYEGYNFDKGANSFIRNFYIFKDVQDGDPFIDDYVEICTLDELMNGNKVTFIKSDIEGFELEMLLGAANTIKTHYPKLSICVYHKPNDIFMLPKYIRSIAPEYKMFLRHHSRTLSESVLYCIRGL